MGRFQRWPSLPLAEIARTSQHLPRSFLCRAAREVSMMAELALGQAREGVSAFAEVTPLQGYRGGLGDG